MLQEVKDELQPHGACTLPGYKENTKNKKTSYKVSVPKKLTILSHSQYTTVMDQSFLRMPITFLHRISFLNLM